MSDNCLTLRVLYDYRLSPLYVARGTSVFKGWMLNIIQAPLDKVMGLKGLVSIWFVFMVLGAMGSWDVGTGSHAYSMGF